MEGSLFLQSFEFSVALSWAYFCFYALFRNGEIALAASVLKSVLEFPEYISCNFCGECRESCLT